MKPKSELFDSETRQDILNILPVTITSLSAQKRDPGRISVFGDKKFLFGLPAPALRKLDLHVDLVLTKEIFSEIESVVYKENIRTWLLILLGKRAYSRYLLAEKCRKDGYPIAVTTSILDEFENKGWINDESYARAYANDKFRFQKWGPKKIRVNLLSKGISNKTAETVVSALIGSNDQIEMLHKLVEKRKNHFLRENDILKRKKKVVDYLLRKGYDHNLVFSQYEKLLPQILK